MRRRDFVKVIAGSAVVWPFVAMAQKKIATIGFMGAGAAETSGHLLDALRQGLRENGLGEGKDYVLIVRWAEGHYERFSVFAREFIEKDVRVIIVNTIAAGHAAQNATSVIPIVMASINDPVGNGLVASLAHPGGNVTGMANVNEDVTPKLIEFLRAFFPKAANAAVLFNPANPSNGVYLERVRTLAAPAGIAIQEFSLSRPGDLEAVFTTIAEKRPDALLVIPDAATLDLGGRIAALSLQHRISVIS